MSAADLSWRTITPSHATSFLGKGTAIAQAIVPGTLSRFALVEVRTLGADRYPSVRYSVRDAATVSDADLRAGLSAREVASFDGIDEALAFVGTRPDAAPPETFRTGPSRAPTARPHQA